ICDQTHQSASVSFNPNSSHTKRFKVSGKSESGSDLYNSVWCNSRLINRVQRLLSTRSGCAVQVLIAESISISSNFAKCARFERSPSKSLRVNLLLKKCSNDGATDRI